MCEKPQRGFFAALLIAAFYEFILLNHFKYRDYLLATNTSRIDFFDANKEGVFSIIGYISIYLAGQAICIFLKNSLNNNWLVFFSILLP